MDNSIITEEDFEDYLFSENNKFKLLQGDVDDEADQKEYIDEVNTVRAWAFAQKMQIHNVVDIYIFCASMNLLNTFVKQATVTLGYGFKNKISKLFMNLPVVKENIVFIDYHNAQDCSLLMVNIGPVQFSFHSVFADSYLEFLLKEKIKIKSLQWDGIRKQKCALTVFLSAMRVRNLGSNLGDNGFDMNNWEAFMLKKYRKNPSSFFKSKKVKGYINFEDKLRALQEKFNTGIH